MPEPGEEESIRGDWYATAFGALYPVVYAHRSVAAARPEAEFAVRQLRLRRSERALDLCCGNGRHMVGLIEHCDSVVGLDYSADLLRIARRQAGPKARLIRGDMRILPFPSHFDALFSFFTSFGYFDDADNARSARAMCLALKPGGRLFIDYLNPAFVEATLVPFSRRDSQGYAINETRWIDSDKGRVNKTTEVLRKSAVVARMGESVRLYSLEELGALLRRAGLEIDAAYGDYDAAGVAEDRPRIILVARRKEGHA